MRHLKEHSQKHELYRLFYYDCPPIDKQIYHPLTGTTINMKCSKDSVWMGDFLAVKKICAGALTSETLEMKHFEPTIKQKCVDMKLGIDIASLAYKKQVEQIVLIAGDSDFVPAAKLARREGLDVVLDPMDMIIRPDQALLEHIDGLRSCGNPYPQKQNATDPFASGRNMAHLRRGVAALNAGKGAEHELLED